MYSHEEYLNLKKKYGSYSSWAIWDPNNESNTAIIEENLTDLTSNYVFLGLNISASLENTPWINFHGGKHDRKLKYASNDTFLRGSYITDLFKDLPEPVAKNVTKNLSKDEIKDHVSFFVNEMKDVKLSDNSVLIVFGQEAAENYEKYFKEHFDNRVIFTRHYSDTHLTDEKWVEEFWSYFNINEDATDVIRKYKK